MNRTIFYANIRIDVTAKAQCLGLCPMRHDVMVLIEQPLMNDVALLTDAPVAHDVQGKLHWMKRLDTFIDQVRVELGKAPDGCRSFDFEITASSSRRLGIHAEIEKRFNKHILVFSLAGRGCLAA
nr:hypothetical protein [uncultured Halomonas sp.]